MIDRELLELAAKAYGIVGHYYCGVLNDNYVDGIITINADGNEYGWNPIEDDGDALRLAVKLGIALDRTVNRCWTFAAGMAINGVCEEFYNADPYAATRRAITRAAAEIGKQMEGNK